MKRRDFLQATAATCAVAIANPRVGAVQPPFELDELTISDLQQGLQSGKYTSRELVEKYSDRINEIDKKGPALHSVIEMNPDAEKIAADARSRTQRERTTRPASRHSDSYQRQHRHARSDDDHCRFTRTGRRQARSRCICRAKTPRSRRSDSWKDESQRVGQLSLN